MKILYLEFEDHRQALALLEFLQKNIENIEIETRVCRGKFVLFAKKI